MVDVHIQQRVVSPLNNYLVSNAAATAAVTLLASNKQEVSRKARVLMIVG